MPRKTKETNLNEIDKPIKKSTKKTTAKMAVATKKATPKKTVSSKTVTAKKSSTVKKNTTKKATGNKSSTSKTSTTKRTSVKKTAERKTSSSSKNSTSNARQPLFSVEYYDLPYRYNETVVKILAQTPTNLFVYWEISDETREQLKNQYGEYVFQITRPVLVVHNITLNYSFEIEINDFANCWYFNVNDSNSEYKVELGRRPIPVNYSYIPNYDIQKNGNIQEIKTPYIYISSSNQLDAPNDKILFNKLGKLLFRNIKTNQVFERDIKDFPFIFRDGEFIDIYKLYQELYKEEFNNNSFNLYNPSSGNLGSGGY